MRRIVIGAVCVAALSACSDDPGRRPAEDVARPVEVAQADSALISLDDTSAAEVTPVEEQEQRPTPAPRPRPRLRPKPVAADPIQPDSVTVEPVADTAALLPADTARPPTPVPPPARSPDTVGTSRPTVPASPRPVVPSMEGSAGPDRAVTLPAGTEFHAALVDSIHSRHDSAGQTLTANVMENVLSPDGSTLIPAGATVQLTLLRLEPAKSKGSADGRLELRVDGISRGGELFPVTAEVRPIPHELRGRGVTGSEAAKVGVGAAAGAIAGRVIGGDTRGAVIGGVVGAAGGAAVASQTADRDIVVKAGTPISFVLTAPLMAGRL